MSASSSERCITCADEGVPMTVVRAEREAGLALCRDPEGAPHTVETLLVDPVAPGDQILVHAGVALVAL